MRRVCRIALLGTLLSVLAGCGNKGPLVLPDAPPPSSTVAAAAAASVD